MRHGPGIDAVTLGVLRHEAVDPFGERTVSAV
jgi:hypothetical protein